MSKEPGSKSQMSLICGDCLLLMQELKDESIDLILCDLPYGKTRNQWDQPIPFAPLWEQYERIIKPHGAIVLFGSGSFSADLIASNKRLYRYSLVWHKTTPTGFLNAGRQPLRAHEDIIVFGKSQTKYRPQKTSGHQRKVSTAQHKRTSKKSTNYGNYGNKGYDSTERYPTSVISFGTDKQKSSLHPTQKPVALLEWLIKSYTDEGDTVLDNCMGSGSTGVACLHTKRDFIGMEKDETFFNMAKERIESERKDGGANDAERKAY